MKASVQRTADTACQPASCDSTQQIALDAQSEAGSLLDLFATQIQAALDESSGPMERLVKACGEIAENNSSLLHDIEAAQDVHAARMAVLKHCQTENQRLARLVTAFQFYDRLTQELQHVHEGLSLVAGALYRVSGSPRAVHWPSIHERIRERFSMERERLLFDVLLGRMTPDDALERCDEVASDETLQAGKVELF